MTVNENNEKTVNYETYIQSADWQEKAELAKKQAFYRCQICNRHQDQVQLDAHHRTYERLGKEIPEDVTVLCRDCHALYSRYERLVKHGFFTVQKARPAQSISELINKYDSDSEKQFLGKILTGLVDFDLITLGLCKSDLTLIAGRSGVGKTSLAIGIALNSATQFNKRVVIFSLSHSSEQIVQKIVSQSTGIDYRNSQTGRLNEDEKVILDNELARLATLKIIIDDTPALTPQNLRDKCFALYAEEEIDFVIIDGLELMYPQSHAIGRRQETKEIAREIKNLARELDVQILATTSEIDSTEKRIDKRPILSDLPNNLEQVADVVVFPHNAESSIMSDFDINQSNSNSQVFDLIIAKNRNGSVGTVQILFQKSIAKFVNAVAHVFKEKAK